MYPLIDLFGWQVPTYFLVQSLIAVLALVWVRSRALALDFPVKTALDSAFFILIISWVGARVLHILWEAPTYYLREPRLIMDFASGGFVYYGGLWAGLGAGWILLRRDPDKSLGEWFDFYAPIVAFGTALGRVGCFLAGCCFGKSCDLPWAIAGRHPVQLYLLFWDLAAMVLILVVERRWPTKKRAAGFLFAGWLIVHGVGRFASEFLRDDDRGPVFLLSISQWLSLALVAAGIRFICLNRPGSAKTDGSVVDRE